MCPAVHEIFASSRRPRRGSCGADLNPPTHDEDTAEFHAAMQAAQDPHDPTHTNVSRNGRTIILHPHRRCTAGLVDFQRPSLNAKMMRLGAQLHHSGQWEAVPRKFILIVRKRTAFDAAAMKPRCSNTGAATPSFNLAHDHRTIWPANRRQHRCDPDEPSAAANLRRAQVIALPPEPGRQVSVLGEFSGGQRTVLVASTVERDFDRWPSGTGGLRSTRCACCRPQRRFARCRSICGYNPPSSP
jgi:hypothetical protein